jgi:spore coat protein U-like protein
MRCADCRLATAFVLGILLAPTSAEAACTVSATGVAFGAYNPNSAAPDDATGTINATCLIFDQAPRVEIGTGNSGSFSPRELDNGSWQLNYNLYTSAARNIVWGDGSAGTGTVTLTGGSNFILWRTYARTIYGRIPTAQAVREGTYTDTLMVTIVF